MVDELGELQKTLAPFRSAIAREATLKAAVRDAHKFAAAEAEISIEGQHYRGFLTARGTESVIDIPRLMKAIKAAEFVKFATCTLKALREHVAPEIAADVVTVKQIGPRTLIVTPRAPR